MVTDFFRHDHDRLEGLFHEFYETRKIALFQRLALAMDRHLDLEDNQMFPVYERRAGQAGQQPIRAMRTEHEELKNLLTTVHSHLANNNSAVALAATRLGELMELHHSREEAIVYGLIDDQLNDAERERLFARLDEWGQAS